MMAATPPLINKCHVRQMDDSTPADGRQPVPPPVQKPPPPPPTCQTDRQIQPAKTSARGAIGCPTPHACRLAMAKKQCARWTCAALALASAGSFIARLDWTDEHGMGWDNRDRRRGGVNNYIH
ncbi:hypothetical protein JDV02_010677 [Purpureocillium takamizusanense]|uniref:Uncharacterized protein n=1 Tax=Purpureocillium takamizusanense TaxID=2060973 RepID=A0A9Q8VHI3_9HYPO|nr:uncharacterized protein JDV02_010677 [Purpureocillium takamizusanense]UNI24964.1 hypothetical protein JDV02_010677 [Purpureocillium takamizusanense]